MQVADNFALSLVIIYASDFVVGIAASMAAGLRASVFKRLSLVATTLYRRNVSTTSAFSLVYEQNGDPAKVIRWKMDELASVGPEDVLVEMLAAPINPADINMIQGVYPIRPAVPAIGGNEGVGKIVKKGNAVIHLAHGDWVVPIESGWGTWRTHAVCKAHQVMKIPNNIPVVSAATMAVNPCTAYRMLHDFVPLRPGDVIIQNASNSGVGQAVIQLAASMKLTTVNVIRNRPECDQLVEMLKGLGATHVITDTELNSKDGAALFKSIPKPKLAFNGVGGKAAGDMARVLAYGAVMVTYGGMSKQPMLLPTAAFIFSDITVRGFWMTRWNSLHVTSVEREKMWNELCALVRGDRLKPPKCELVQFKDFQQAIEKSMQSSLSSTKQVLTMSHRP